MSACGPFAGQEHLERDDRRHRAGRDVAEHLGDGGARRRLHRHTDDFWGRGKHKNVDENTDVQDPSKPRCPNCNELCKSQRGINIHLARSKCKPVSNHIGNKTRRDVVRRKTKEDAGKLPKVNVQGTDLKTVTVFRYLGSQIESNATTDRDVEARLGAARTMFNRCTRCGSARASAPAPK